MIRWACICYVLSSFSLSIAFKWVPSSSGQPIPQNVVYLNVSSRPPARIIVRARHFDEVLPGELDLEGKYAIVNSCSKTINKYQYEILVLDANELCEWRKFESFYAFPIDVVKGGNTAEGEPIFIGSLSDYYSSSRHYLSSIRFSTKNIIPVEGNNNGHNFYLTCRQNVTWIDTLAADIPKNSISGGKSNNGKLMYVGRIKSRCAVLPGEVVPFLGKATGLLENGTEVTSPYAQVLVGDAKDYSWKRSQYGEIPDHAVVSSQASDRELMYVSRNKTKLGYVLHSKAVDDSQTAYDILVKN